MTPLQLRNAVKRRVLGIRGNLNQILHSYSESFHPEEIEILDEIDDKLVEIIKLWVDRQEHLKAMKKSNEK